MRSQQEKTYTFLLNLYKNGSKKRQIIRNDIAGKIEAKREADEWSW